jgi:hypothetical protein
MSRNLDRLSHGHALGLSRIIDAKFHKRNAGGDTFFLFDVLWPAARPT